MYINFKLIICFFLLLVVNSEAKRKRRRRKPGARKKTKRNARVEVSASGNAQEIQTKITCGVDRRLNLTNTEFIEHYRQKKPVIFRSSTTESARATIADLILAKNGPYRNLKIKLAPVMELGAQEPILGGKQTEATLKWYLNAFSYTQRAPYYIFDSKLLNRLPKVQKLFIPPTNVVGPGFDAPEIVTIGKPSSGLPFHFHRESWLDVLHGRKHWQLYAPESLPEVGYSAWETQVQWNKVVYPSLPEDQRPIECIQQAGEVLYLPEGWYHSVMNLDLHTVGIVRQPTDAMPNGFYGKLVSSAAHKKEGDLVKAKEALQAAVALAPRISSLRRKLGSMLEELGDIEGAIQAHREAIERNRRHPASYLELAGLLNDRGDHKKALAVLREAQSNGANHHPAVDGAAKQTLKLIQST